MKHQVLSLTIKFKVLIISGRRKMINEQTVLQQSSIKSRTIQSSMLGNFSISANFCQKARPNSCTNLALSREKGSFQGANILVMSTLWVFRGLFTAFPFTYLTLRLKVEAASRFIKHIIPHVLHLISYLALHNVFILPVNHIKARMICLNQYTLYYCVCE